MKHKVIKLVDPGCALVSAIIDLETEIMGQKIRFNDFRMLLTFHCTAWRITKGRA